MYSEKDGRVPLASIIILTYKNLQHLNNALNSCFSQEYENIEIVISDDGTPDFNAKFIQDLCRTSKFNIADIQIRHSDMNQGTVKNFNSALKLCTGKVIIPLACDDTFFNNKAITNIMSFFLKQEVLVATCKQLHIEPENKMTVSPHFCDKKILEKTDLFKLWLRISAFPCFIGGSCTCYRKELFEKYGLFDEKYKLLEDWPMYLKLLENNEQIGFINCITIRHNYGGVSFRQGGGRNLQLVIDDLKCLRNVLIVAEEKNINWFQKRLLKYRENLLLKEQRNNRNALSFRYLDVWIYHVVRKVIREIVKLLTNKKFLAEG